MERRPSYRLSGRNRTVLSAGSQNEPENGATGGITAGAQTDLPTTGTQAASNIVDLGGPALPGSASGGGARDLGVGDDPALKLSALVTTAITGGTSLQLQLQGAPDNGSGAPGSYTTMWTSRFFPRRTKSSMTCL